MSALEGDSSNTKSTLKENRPRKICESYDSEDADVELISSDNVIFKVHSYQLQCVSPVFRSTIAIASSTSQQNPIPLTHPTIDHSRVVKAALDIIYTVGFDIELVQDDMDLVKYVIDFAKKWGISRITNIIQKEISQKLDPRREAGPPVEYFLVAVYLGDNVLAARYFRTQFNHYHYRCHEVGVNVTGGDGLKANEDMEQESTKLPHHYLSDTPARGLTNDLLSGAFAGPSLDFGNMTYDQFLRFTPTLVWSVLRAQTAIHEEDETRGREEILLDILNLAYPPPKSAESSKKRKSED